MYTDVLSYLHMLTTTQYMLLQRVQTFFWIAKSNSAAYRELRGQDRPLLVETVNTCLT
jgi:hypothetical protein